MTLIIYDMKASLNKQTNSKSVFI